MICRKKKSHDLGKEREREADDRADSNCSFLCVRYRVMIRDNGMMMTTKTNASDEGERETGISSSSSSSW